MCPPVVLCNWIYFIPSLFVCTIMHDCCLSAYSFVCFYGYLALCVCLSITPSCFYVWKPQEQKLRDSQRTCPKSLQYVNCSLSINVQLCFFFFFISEPNHTEARDFFLPVNSRLELLLSLPSAP